jgi:hypothetical protein
MDKFLQRFGEKVIGVLQGFDRLRFRGSKRGLCYAQGMLGFLWQVQILLKDFGPYAEDTTNTLCRAIETRAQEMDLPTIYLASSSENKELRALANAREKGLSAGPIAVLSCVEPCRSCDVGYEAQTKKLVPILKDGKCLHYYHYYLDPRFGLMYTRLQSWFPFTMHIGLNGREWLAEQLKAANIDYLKCDNCFTQVGDFTKAQQLLDAQVQLDWSAVLEELAARSNPLHTKLLQPVQPYYWSTEASEWATDILFRSPADLAKLYPTFVRHGIETLHSSDVMRFLGHKVMPSGRVHGKFEGEVTSERKQRQEGVCVRYHVNSNSAKAYDKHGNLRLEATHNNVREYRTLRTLENEPEGTPPRLQRMRKGVADIQARAELGRQVNERHAASLATVAELEPLGDLVEKVCEPVVWHGRRCRGMNLLASKEVALLEAVSRGDFLINGFRNRDVRALLHGTEEVSATERRRQSSAVTRQLRLLRAHDLIEKIAQSHRYQLTAKGQRSITALMAARRANTPTLLDADKAA